MNPELATALSSPTVPAFHGNNVVQMAGHGTDKNLTVRFFIEPVENTFKSEKEGRVIYEDVAFVHISAPGAKTDIIRKVVLEDRMDVPSDPNRFPRQWQQFKNQQEQVPDGTPLEMCAFLSKARVMELKSQRIFTAEHYATLPDSTLQTLGLGALRERELCKAFLGNDDTKTRQLSEALAQVERMRQELAALMNRPADPSIAPSTAAYAATAPLQEAPRTKRAYHKKETV